MTSPTLLLALVLGQTYGFGTQPIVYDAFGVPVAGPVYGWAAPAGVVATYPPAVSTAWYAPSTAVICPGEAPAVGTVQRQTDEYGPAPGGAFYRGPGLAAAPTPVVRMTDEGRFEPALVTVNVGDTVEWRSVSRESHTVTANPDLAGNPAHVVLPRGGSPFHSGEIPPGGRFEHTFTTPGIYIYVCLPHEEMGMIGIVVVTEPEGGHGRAPAPEGRGGGY